MHIAHWTIYSKWEKQVYTNIYIYIYMIVALSIETFGLEIESKKKTNVHWNVATAVYLSHLIEKNIFNLSNINYTQCIILYALAHACFQWLNLLGVTLVVSPISIESSLFFTFDFQSSFYLLKKKHSGLPYSAALQNLRIAFVFIQF